MRKWFIFLSFFILFFWGRGSEGVSVTAPLFHVRRVFSAVVKMHPRTVQNNSNQSSQLECELNENVKFVQCYIDLVWKCRWKFDVKYYHDVGVNSNMTSKILNSKAALFPVLILNTVYKSRTNMPYEYDVKISTMLAFSR